MIMITVTKPCVGVAVKSLNKDVRNFVVKEYKDKLLVGVPFQGALPFTTIKDCLLQDQVVTEDQILGNFMFFGEITSSAS